MPTKTCYKVVGNLESFDERNNVQALNTHEPGSEEYKEFYTRHSEWERKD